MPRTLSGHPLQGLIGRGTSPGQKRHGAGVGFSQAGQNGPDQSSARPTWQHTCEPQAGGRTRSKRSAHSEIRSKVTYFCSEYRLIARHTERVLGENRAGRGALYRNLRSLHCSRGPTAGQAAKTPENGKKKPIPAVNSSFQPNLQLFQPLPGASRRFVIPFHEDAGRSDKDLKVFDWLFNAAQMQ